MVTLVCLGNTQPESDGYDIFRNENISINNAIYECCDICVII